jgi:hypothetical protein
MLTPPDQNSLQWQNVDPDTPVSDATKDRYVDAMGQFKLFDSIADDIEAFRAGFELVVRQSCGWVIDGGLGGCVCVGGWGGGSGSELF